MQAPPRGTSALPKLLLFLLAVMMAGALLAAPLFELGNWARHWLPASPLAGTGFAKFLLAELGRAHFTRYFNRAVLIAAIALIPPLALWIRPGRGLLPPFSPILLGMRQWIIGFCLAAVLLLALGFWFVKLGAYQLRPDAHWLGIGGPITAALGAGIVEEIFFRGLLLGLLLRSMKTPAALFWCTFIFALVHFLKPPDGWQIADADVTWYSGFAVLAQIARAFGDLQFLLAEFATLFAVGWVLVMARMKTGALWAGMGLHGGWVFGLKYFSAATFYNPGWLPWIGTNLKIGVAPLITVLLTGWIALKLLGRAAPAPASDAPAEQ